MATKDVDAPQELANLANRDQWRAMDSASVWLDSRRETGDGGVE
jgi:hypothetical protein